MRRVILFVGLFSFFAFGLLKPDIEIDGKGKGWDLITKGSLTVPTGSKLTLKRMVVDNLQGTASSSRLVMHHSTSQLVLENSTLSLDGNYSFTQGSLVVKGDCTITGTEGTLFTFNGHNILIDDDATLRVENVTFQAVPTSRMRQLVRYGNSTSELLLDNATFKCDNAPSALLSSGGMVMVGGNLVIEGSSVVDNTGTSSMHALFLGNGSYSSSDCRLVVRPRSKLTVRNAGIVFKNVGVGSLGLSGGEGTLVVDTSANFLIETQVNLGGSTFNFDFSRLAGVSRNTLSFMGISIDGDHGATVNSVDWRPDGLYLALGGSVGAGGYTHRVYSFDGTSFSHEIASANIHGANVNSVSWNPTGAFFAIGGGQAAGTNYTHRVYSFDGTETTSLLSSIVGHGANVNSVDWSPDGRYLAISGSPSSNVTHRVYSFDGTTATTLSACNKDHGTTLLSVAWSPSGRYLAIGGVQSPTNVTHRVYSFDGLGLTELVNSRGNHGGIVRSVSWSSDEKYLAIAGFEVSNVSYRLYSFDGSSLTEVTNGNVGSFRVVSWSSNGRYLLLGGDNATHFIYNFDGSSLILVDDAIHGGQPLSFSWYPDDRFLAIGGDSGTGGFTHRAYPSVYSSSNAVAQFQNVTLNLGGGAFKLDDIELRGN